MFQKQVSVDEVGHMPIGEPITMFRGIKKADGTGLSHVQTPGVRGSGQPCQNGRDCHSREGAGAQTILRQVPFPDDGRVSAGQTRVQASKQI